MPAKILSAPISVGLLSNPHSGKNQKHLHSIDNLLANQPHVLHRSTRTADAIPATLAEFADKPVDVLAINGGDGTVAQVLTHLLEHSPFQQQPWVLLLPGGTTNMNAGDVGLRGNLIHAIKRMCEWSATERGGHQLLQRPVLRVEPGTRRAAAYAMFFGAGAIVQGIEYCHAKIHSKGVGNEIGPGLAMARTFWGIAKRDPRFFQSVPVSLALEGQDPVPEQNILLLLISSLERLFLGMQPYWGSGTGNFHISLIREKPQRFIRAFPSLLCGKPNRHATPQAGYESFNTDSLQLRINGAFTLDGEIFRADPKTGPVTITDGGPVTFVRL